MLARRSFLAFLLPGILLSGLLVPDLLFAAPWIVVTEIHYNPPAGEGEEFVEILSREPPRADLSGWTLEGEINFRFPRGTTILPGEYLVIARDPRALKMRHPTLRRVLGPFTGRLDNKGGGITLRNAAGARAYHVRYDSRGRWTAIPDGTGHTLSIRDPLFDPEDPLSWVPSLRLGGTPGASNLQQVVKPEKPIIKKGTRWKYWRGNRDPGAAWREVNFGDVGWAIGPSGFGFGDSDDTTVIQDMQGNYLSLFTRLPFNVKDPNILDNLILRVDYDDGFIAYLNGKEIARASMGKEGLDVPYNQPASGPHEAGVPTEYDLGPASRLLVQGRNVIAVQVHNVDINSSDLSLIVELSCREASGSPGALSRPRINEVLVGRAPEETFIEIYNDSPGEIDLSGYFLSDDPANLKKFEIPRPASMKPYSHTTFTARELGPAFRLSGPDLFLTLTEPGGQRVVDVLPVGGSKAAGEGKNEGKAVEDPLAGKPRGRFPDGSRDIEVLEVPTPGAPNRVATRGDIVINEIMYNPISGDEDFKYIELYNRGDGNFSLNGYRLAGAVRYRFKSSRTIPPGGYLVVARDPAALVKNYGIPRARVAGPYSGTLSAGGEEIILRDPLGNVEDRVLYADRDPWPVWADGLGSSLELIHPDLDNELPASWAPSDDRSKAKWETFSYAKEHRLFNRRNVSEFQFLLLTEGECLIDNILVGGLIREGFEGADSSWKALGTHERSGIYREDAASGKACYRLVASGRGNSRTNFVARPIPAGLEPGRTYRVSFRAKWQRGSRLLLTRTPGQGIAQTHRLTIPSRLGTPGAKNSTWAGDAPPAIGTPLQVPIAPSANQAVALSARISARVPVKSAYIHYRTDGSLQWQRADLTDGGAGREGDGLWGGQVPGLPAGKVEFYLAAVDAEGKLGTFPPGAPRKTALYAVGLTQSRKFPTYTLVVSDLEWQGLQDRPRLSNQLARATLIYGDSRIFYNVGFRQRGSPFTRPNDNWRIVLGAENLDGRGTLTVDGQNKDGTKLNERLTYWILNQLQVPNVRQQYVYFRILGREEGIYEDVEKVDRDFLNNWFDFPLKRKEKKESEKRKSGKKTRRTGSSEKEEKREGGLLHKVDDYWELATSGRQGYQEAFLRFISQDPEDYRWNFPQRINSVDEDFQPLMKLIHTIDARTTQDRSFPGEFEASADVDTWLRVLAARTIVDDWDTLGRDRGKNAFLYYSYLDRRWRLLPWDCDLAWRNANSPIISGKFPGIQRILSYPPYRRRFTGYLSYLSRRILEPQHFATILKDLNAYSGAATGHFSQFAQARRSFLDPQIPAYPLKLTEIRRITGKGEPDLARATGTAPPVVMRFRLNGREGKVQFAGEFQWGAEIPVGPEGGLYDLQALDFGGNLVASVKVRVRPRSGAMPLPPLEEATPSVGELVSAPPPPGPAREETAPGVELMPPPEKAAPPAEVVKNVPPEEPGKASGNTGDAVREKEGEGGEHPPPTGEEMTSLTGEAGGEERPPVGGEFLSERRGLGLRSLGERGTRRTRRYRPGEAWVEETSQPSGAGAPEAFPAVEEPEESGSPLNWIVPLVLALGIVQLPLLLLLRKLNLLEKLKALFIQWFNRQEPRAPSARKCLQDLGDRRFDRASRALARLCESPRENIPVLLEALGDNRRTPFHKIRRAGRGFSATPAKALSQIRVRHLAALILEAAIGKPPVQRPSRNDWQAHWEKARKSN